MTFHPLHRIDPCNICDCNVFNVERSLSLVKKGVREVYDEYCADCGNLLYGYSKMVKMTTNQAAMVD